MLSSKVRFIEDVLRCIFKNGPIATMSLLRQYHLIKKSGLFHIAWYKSRHPDVLREGVNPILHYLLWGAREGRDPNEHFSTLWYQKQNAPADNPLSHYILQGRQKGLRTLPEGFTNSRDFELKRDHQALQDFDDYLKAAMLHPELICAPIDRFRKRALAVLNSFRKRLLQRHAKLEQNLKISIVIPMLEQDRKRGKALHLCSLLTQQYSNFEAVVVSNCEDARDTFDENPVSKDPRFSLVELERGASRAEALLAALDKCSGDYLSYFDSETRWDETYLLLSIAQLQENAQCKALYSAQMVFDPAIPQSPGELCLQDYKACLRCVRFAPFNPSLLENRNYIPLSSLIHHRSLLKDIASLELRAQERKQLHWEFLLKILQHCTPFALPAILSYCSTKVDFFPLESEVHSFTGPQEGVDGFLRQKPLEVPFEEDDERDFPLPTLFESPASKSYDKVSKKVSIIIPSFEALDYFKLCYRALCRYTPRDSFQLIVVDNASGEGVQNFLDLIEREGATVLRNKDNLGFTKGVNQGMEVAKEGRDIVLLNNDAIVTPYWLQALQEAINVSPEVGLSVPREVRPPGSSQVRRHIPSCNPMRELDVSLSMNAMNVLERNFAGRAHLIELKSAAFFCVYIDRETVDRLGPLDVKNGPHYRSDMYYCDLLRNYLKKKIVYTANAKVYHFHQRSSQDLRKKSPEQYFRLVKRNVSPERSAS